jgi:hypothetical protein
VALTALVAPTTAAADTITAPVSGWVPDGEVKAMAVSGSTAYIGGNFTRIGPYTGSSAMFDSSSGNLKPWPEVEGVVNAVAVDGAGGWYLGGDFRSVGGVARTDLAHVLPDGTVDPNWAPTTNGTVRALAVDNPGGPVYAGGEFSMANDTGRGNLAGFGRADGALTDFRGGVQFGLVDFAGIHALLLAGPTLYVGGIFDSAQGALTAEARNRAAAFTVATSALLPWDPNANHTVNGLALDPDATDGADVFISGRFNGINDPQVARHGLAKVDAATGVADANWIAPLQFGPELTAMAVSATFIYIGGSNIRFNLMDPARTAAAISITGAVPSATWNPTVSGTTSSLAVAGSTVYIGSGNFGSGVLTPGPHAALTAVDTTNATPTGFAPQFGRGKQQFPSGQTVGTRAIAVNGSDVVAGGTFMNAGGVERRNLAAIDLNTGQPTAFDPPMKGQFSNFSFVNAVAVTTDGLVWAGGQFLTEDPNPRSGLAAFDAGSGALASFHRDVNGNGVSALAASGPMVYVGGQFTQVGSEPRQNVAAVQNVPGEDGTVLPFDVATDGIVRALALSGDTLYLGGQFQNVNTTLASLKRARSNAAAVDAGTGVARPWDPNLDAPVDALATAGDTVFLGGEFATANGGSAGRQRLAAVDSQSGAARAWAPSADAPVRALAVQGPTVFAGGDFATVSGAARSGVAALDGQSGAPDPSGIELGPEERNGPLPPVARVDALFASPAAGLLAGGGFVMRAPSPRAANLARFGLEPPPAGGAGPDVTDPALGLGASRRRFGVGARRMAPTGNAIATARRARKGTTLRLTLSEAAQVRFTVLRKLPGRRAGRRCVKPTRRNRGRKRCTRLVRSARFARSAPQGRSRVPWSGRIRRKALKRGRYLLRATPTDQAGNVGGTRSLSITIVR